MSAVERLRNLLGLPVAILASLSGWLLVAPIAALIPKRHDWIAVIGRQDGRFLDNAKYFFLQARQLSPGLRIAFVTERADVIDLLAGSHHEVLRYPTFRGVWFLLRTGTVVVDEASWSRKARFFLLIRAKVVQLWHGVASKRVELDLWRHETGRFAWASQPLVLQLRLLAYRVTGRRMRYAAIATTSRFYRDEVFAPAFLARHFPVTGYPRNDFGQSLDDINRALAWRNVDSVVADQLEFWKRLGHRLVLIAPTFRQSGAVPMQLDPAMLRTIDAFAEANGVEFLFKFHPSERNVDHIAGSHFHVCARDSDIYPLLPHAAALVTDYSSISMDFLLIDKPMLFLVPADDDYTRNDRQLQFDPRTMMPGPVVHHWPALLEALRSEWMSDAHAEERAALRRKAFDGLPQAEAVPKLLALMRKQQWIATRAPTAGKDSVGSAKHID
jgi:CDP-glycerol glycerophosphotransferase (TagB/SpsB family)